MTWDEEWGAARARTSGSLQTRINSTANGGQDGPGLTVNQDDLGAVGHDAHLLHGQLSRAGDHARPATFSAATALTNGNFTSGAQLTIVHDRWNTQLRTLLDACAQISNHLDYSKKTHARNDADIEGELTAVSKLSQYIK